MSMEKWLFSDICWNLHTTADSIFPSKRFLASFSIGNREVWKSQAKGYDNAELSIYWFHKWMVAINYNMISKFSPQIFEAYF